MTSPSSPCAGRAATAAASSFGTLPLSPATLANLQRLGYLEMTPIQAASLPAALLGKDLIAQAKTGSGKTAAFALTLLASLNGYAPQLAVEFGRKVLYSTERPTFTELDEHVRAAKAK